MRIALFHPCLIHGGIPRVFVNLARGFVERGHAVDLVQATPEGDFRSEVPACIRLVDLNSRRALTSIAPLAGYLRRERPDALISGAIQTNIAAVCASRLVRQRPRLILTEHNVVSVISAGAPLLRTRMTPALIRAFYPFADEVVAVSQGAAADLAKIMRVPTEKIKVIYNPIISEQFWQRASATLNDARVRQGSPPIILAVGRLHEHKDYATLIRAFARIRGEMEAKLIFLGSGEEGNALGEIGRELKVDGDIAFLGDVPNPLPYMKAAAVLALSSRVEALPTVLIEALAMGLPIVATDCPTGPREILADGAYGTLVPVGDEAMLADKIMAVLRSPSTAPVSEAALARFDHDRVIDQYLSLLPG